MVGLRWAVGPVAFVALVAMASPAPAQPLAALVDPGSAMVVDSAAEAGLYEVNKSWSAKPVDYDLDGDQDLWIGYHQWSSKLWRNNGDGTYTRVALNAWPRVNADGKIPDRHDCAWADVDRNGLPDAYCSAGRNQSNLVKTGMDNELWLQSTPGVFSEVGTQWGVGDVCGRGRFVTFLDANGDEYPDLFLGNSTERSVSDRCDDPANGLPNEESKLFINQAGTGFAYRPDLMALDPAAGERCAETFDFNGDGLQDLLACAFRRWSPRLYRHNPGGGFTEVAGSVGLTKAIGDAVPIDLDHDGDLDLVTSSDGDFGYQLNLGGRFGASVVIARVPSGAQGRSVAAGDVDGDGDVDVYALMSNIDNQTNPDDLLLINNGSLGFTALPVPRAGGTGDEVIAVDRLGTGVTEFLVLNGYNATVGPVQLIGLRSGGGGGNSAPTARFTSTCSGLTCRFDGSASTDPDADPLTLDWSFGDGAVGSGATPSHTYAAAGSYDVTLEVVDDSGASDSVTHTVRPTEAVSAVAFRAAASSGGRAASQPSVVIPPTVQAGDALLLFVSNGLTLTPTPPAGWTRLGSQVDSELRTDVFWTFASAGSAGSSVQVPLLTSTGALRAAPTTLTVAAYSGVTSPPVSTFASAAEPSSTYVSWHSTPAVDVPTPTAWVLSYWADRTSRSTTQTLTTHWTPPTGQQLRADAYTVATSGRVTSLLTDDGQASPGGERASLTARADGTTRKATTWTIVLAGGAQS